MQADAFAKVNLSLRVGSIDRRGMHPIRSLVHSIDWPDTVVLEEADADGLEVTGDDAVPADDTNLAWQALEAARRRASMRPPARLRLVKRIPAAAGLGGGSADAAATLMLAAAHLGLTESEAAALAPGLGADVPFCLAGGSALVEGHGEIVIARPPARDFALAVAVPPFALATAAVYRRWDELGEPAGTAVDRRHLPDSLREEAPLVNDLIPAAADLAPELGDWIFDLRRHWGRPVMMSGSGPSLFACFATIAEAEDAARAVGGARAVRACLPAARGWRREAPGTLR